MFTLGDLITTLQLCVFHDAARTQMQSVCVRSYVKQILDLIFHSSRFPAYLHLARFIPTEGEGVQGQSLKKRWQEKIEMWGK